MWTTRLELWVPGVPVQQGSKNAIPMGRRAGPRFIPITRADGMPIVNLTDTNADKLKPWRSHVTGMALDAWGSRPALDEPVCVHIEFVFPRLKSHYGTGKNAAVLKPNAPIYKTSSPDKDKLERAINDALTDAGVWKDDALVCDGGSRKVYGNKTGARIWVQTMTTENDRS